MKLLTAAKIKEWDNFTILHEPITSLDLMERAASLCADEIMHLLSQKKSLQNVMVLCGTGNNGGDGLVIARLLSLAGKDVHVYVLESSTKPTEDFNANFKKLPKTVTSFLLTSLEQIPTISKSTLVVDAMLGSGLNKATTGLIASVIDMVNESEAFVVSVDIPSGLPAEVLDIAQITGHSIIEADITYTFQVPKKSFFQSECFKYTGTIDILDIGLHPGFVEHITTHHFYITQQLVHSFYKPRLKFSHKGIFGHVLMVAGSYGKIGAAILSSKAALRAGCGLVTTCLPKVGYTVLQTALPEAMVITDDEVFEIRNFPDTKSYAAIGVGPGLGTNEYTEKGFASWIKHIHQPIVIDADGLNISASLLAKDSTFSFPPNCILTPHPKEFDRLAGQSNNSFERLHKQLAFAQKHNMVVVLKGAHTSIALPDGRVYFNSSGNVALATAGSGDVLTGIIASLLAQQYSPAEAAILGVYVHGYCADLWVEQQNATMIASDIVEMIPKVINHLFT